VKVDVPVGVYPFICTVHASMQGALQVVGDDVALPSRAELATQRVNEIVADTASAAPLENQNPGFTIDGDRKIWNVLLGDSTPDNHVAINSYIPASLQIAAGDGVRFFFDNNIVDEIHTVSFPSEVTGSFSLGGLGIPYGKGGVGLHPRCDFDDPLTGAPGVPGPFAITPLPCPANLEFGASPWMSTPTPAPGNNVLPGGVHDSALLAPVGAPESYRALPDTGGFLPSTFAAEFPVPGTFTYKCNIHLDPMVGSITVT
jgi:plastocyanin